eukprot:m.44020 g.44020  ORF g.44020 m.44020 type:complete len:193 (+) comp8491_c0_seq1:570-1148(+)
MSTSPKQEQSDGPEISLTSPEEVEGFMAEKLQEEVKDEESLRSSGKVNRSNNTTAQILIGHGIMAACATVASLLVGFLANSVSHEPDAHNCPYVLHGAVIKIAACCVGLVTLVSGAYVGATARGICAEASSNSEELKTEVSLELMVAITKAQGELSRLRRMMQVTWLATNLSVLVTVVGCGFDGAALLQCEA